MPVELIRSQGMRIMTNQTSRVLLSSLNAYFSEKGPVDSTGLTKRSRPLGTGLRFLKAYKKGFGVLFLILFLAWVMPDKARAYVMPAEQLVGLVSAKFCKFKTLVITQFTHLVNPQDRESEVILKEKIWLKAPDFYHSEVIDQPEDYDIRGHGDAAVYRPNIDMSFHRLFMAKNAEEIIGFLSEMGVEYKSVAFTRFDGIVAYQLGDKTPESPKLLIEKESLLPLLLCYWSQAGLGREMVTVRFVDYKKLGKGWYPDEIAYSAGEEIKERHVILDLQVNIPFE